MMNSVGVDDSAGSCPYSLILSLNEMTVQTVFLSNKVVTCTLLYCDVCAPAQAVPGTAAAADPASC